MPVGYFIALFLVLLCFCWFIMDILLSCLFYIQHCTCRQTDQEAGFQFQKMLHPSLSAEINRNQNEEKEEEDEHSMLTHPVQRMPPGL